MSALEQAPLPESESVHNDEAGEGKWKTVPWMKIGTVFQGLCGVSSHRSTMLIQSVEGTDWPSGQEQLESSSTIVVGGNPEIRG